MDRFNDHYRSSEALVELIRELRDRAQRHRPLLSNNELATRYALIDPILRALGWPTDEPGWVRVEERLGKGRVDYVLYGSDDWPVLLLEAKALGKPFLVAQSAVLSYAWNLRGQGKAPRLVGVTDGMRWALYHPHSLKVLQHEIN